MTAVSTGVLSSSHLWNSLVRWMGIYRVQAREFGGRFKTPRAYYFPIKFPLYEITLQFVPP